MQGVKNLLENLLDIHVLQVHRTLPLRVIRYKNDYINN